MAAPSRSTFLSPVTSKQSRSQAPDNLSHSKPLSLSSCDNLLKSVDAEVISVRLRLCATLLVLIEKCLSGEFLYKSFMNLSLISIFNFLVITTTIVGPGDNPTVT